MILEIMVELSLWPLINNRQKLSNIHIMKVNLYKDWKYHTVQSRYQI